MSDPNPGGLFASLRQLLGTVLETAQVRLELLGTELETEKRRLFDGFMFGAIALMCLGLGLLLLCVMVIALFWDSYRLAAVGGVACVFVAIGVALLVYARQRLRNALGLFYLSAAELQQDRDALQPDRRHD